MDGRDRTLYRGDAEAVDRFDCARTGEGALFGMGIYLTDSREIALDYCLKSSGTVVFRDEEAPSPRALVAAYLSHIVTTETDWKERLEAVRRDWTARYYGQNMHALPDEERERAKADVNAGYRKAMRAEASAYLRRAKDVFRSRRGGLCVVRDTLGQFSLVRKDGGGFLSRFAVPAGYLGRTLHGDRPLPDDALAAVSALMRGVYGDGVADFRNADEVGMRFDDWVESYRRRGFRYAWTERRVGGRGENPSLDVVWNGTHAGISAFDRRDVQAALVASLRGLGYVGIAYDGGVRLAGTGPRGGGGHRHDAFVLWDDDAVNGFRTGVERVVRDDMEEGLELNLRAAAVGMRF